MHIKKITLILFAGSLFAGDAVPTPDLAKQLADANAEIAALRKAADGFRSWANVALGIAEQQRKDAIIACIGNPPQPPAPKPDPKSAETKP